MKWFCALSDGFSFGEFSKLVKVAVYTAQKNTSLVPHFIYDGEDNLLTEWLRERSVRVIKRRSFFYDDLRRVAEERDNPNILDIGSGAFLRAEIPQLCEELGISDKYVLYTDVDVMFRRDVTDSLERLAPRYFAVAPENDRTNYREMNSGVMLMNLKNLRRKDAEFRRVVRENIKMMIEEAWDQTAYKFFYRGRYSGNRYLRRIFPYKWDRLALEFNWKTYWGNYDSAKIIHFHGPKPGQRHLFDGENTPAPLKPLLPLLTPEYNELCEMWDEYYSQC